MSTNRSRRASDARRGKWRQHDARERQTARMFDGSAALKLDSATPRPPQKKLRVILSLCDGLIVVISRFFRFGWWYNVRIGSVFREISEARLVGLWINYYTNFGSATGATATKQSAPAARAFLPAPQQPIALLTSGATAA